MAQREVRVAIIGDPSSLQRALNQSDDGLNRFQSRMQSFSHKAAAVGATLTRSLTLPLLAFGAVGVRELMEGENALAQTRAVIESTGGAANKTVGQIVELSSALSEMSSVDDEDVQALANTLLTFRNIAGPTFDEATEAALDLSAAMGTDLHAAGIQVGRALNDPIRGLTALTRVGVAFSEEQRTAIESMVAFGNTAGAQQIILQELQAEFGGSAEAAGNTFGGQLRKAGQALQEVAADIVTEFIPVLEDVVGWLQNVADWFRGLSDTQKKWVAFAAAFAAAAGPIAFVISAIAGAIAALSIPILLVGGLLIGLGVLLVLTVQHWNEIKEAARQAIGWIITNVPGALPVMFALVSIVVGLWQALQRSVTVGKVLVTTLATIGQQGLGVVLSAYQAFANAISAAWSAARGLLSTLQSIASAASNIPSLPGGIDIPGVPFFAEGGIVSGPTLGVVGEAGPEAIIPLSGSNSIQEQVYRGMRRAMARTVSPVVVVN
jgi:phage-related minor tail protein